MAESIKTKNEIDFPSVDTKETDKSVPLHYHNGVDSPVVDKANKKVLGVLTDYICILNATNVSLANATWTRTSFISELVDPTDMHSSTFNTSRVYPPIGGVYRISGYVRFADNTTGDRGVRIYKRGVTSGIDFYSKADGSGQTTVTFDFSFNLTTLDYVELYLYQSSTGTLNATYVQLNVQLLANV